MAHHQDVQKRVQKEITENISMGTPVTVEDKGKAQPTSLQEK